MELMDKVKQVAGGMGRAAKKSASQVQTKVEHTQLRRRADDAARRLGYLVYHQRTGAGAAEGDADALIAEIRDAKAQIETANAAAEASTSTDTTPAGPDVPPPAPNQAAEEATGE
jgi:hypothetical protein